MKNTEKYQLNLIEKTDTFSPDPLNENTQTTDSLMALADFTALTEAKTRAAETAALDRRVTALEVHRIVAGSYRGDSRELNVWRTIPLDFTPAALIIQVVHAHQCELVIRGADKAAVKIVEKGFQVCSTGGSDGDYNSNFTYIFLALT